MSDLRKEMLKIKIKGYFDNGDLRADPTITTLVKYHVDKARHNIETGSLLMEVSKDKESKKRLKVSADSVIAKKDAEKIYRNAIDFVDTIESLMKGLK